MENVAAKKLALELAIAVSGVTGIIDRLKVAPSARMTDGEIRDHLRDQLLEEPAFRDCAIRARVKGPVETISEPPAARL
jgi:osmotically-inducible protein OsmY